MGRLASAAVIALLGGAVMAGDVNIARCLASVMPTRFISRRHHIHA